MYRARAKAEKNDDQMAVADCNEALRADPDNANAYLLRGKLRRKSLEREAAVADFTEVLKMKPAAAEVFFQRAQVFAELGNTRDAKADYAAAVKQDETLRALGFLAQMDQMTAATKARALSELKAIGFPKVMSDLDYLVATLPKESAEFKAAVVLTDVARTAGLKK
jgi:tetratricopeptide (TPR) repeat protein